MRVVQPHTLLHPPVDFMAPPRPTAIEPSSLSVDVDVARGPNLTGEVRPADLDAGSARDVVKLANRVGRRRPTRIDGMPNMQRPEQHGGNAVEEARRCAK